MINLYGKWLEKYPLISVEDGLSEDDWDAWVKFTSLWRGTAARWRRLLSPCPRLERGIAAGAGQRKY